MHLIYGPELTKRFGVSMSVDLCGPLKVCSFDCAYCSLGPTELTMNAVRKGFLFPTVDQLTAAFREYIKASVQIDSIVVSGNGEPTLHAEFDHAMRALKDLRDLHLPNVPLVVLTNGAHLDQRRVITGLNVADERVVKIDAGNDQIGQRINQPLVRFSVGKLVTLLRKLHSVTVQSLFVRGTVDNTSVDAIDEWIEIIGMIKPREVQLGTLDQASRTTAGLEAVDEDGLCRIAHRLKKRVGLDAKIFTGHPSRTTA